MGKERLTVKNPDGSYRIWMDRAGTFRLESQMNSVFAYGEFGGQAGKIRRSRRNEKEKPYMLRNM